MLGSRILALDSPKPHRLVAVDPNPEQPHTTQAWVVDPSPGQPHTGKA